MHDLIIATAQFEHHDADKAYNLSRIRELSRRAAAQGAAMVSFHECCISGYTFLQSLDSAALRALAEPVPDGPSTLAITAIAREFNLVVMAGLVEIDGDKVHNTYVACGPDGFLVKHRKLHTFIHPDLTPGDRYTVAEIAGVRCGFLICYDNNLPENVRMTTLLGAEVIFMPHVTGCLPSIMPGRGIVAPALWHNRHRDPAALRKEFEGPKARQWLHRWMPARAWENGVYCVYSNPIGIDGDTLKPGGAMILDPYGEVIAESHQLEDDVVVALCTNEKLEQAPGRRYLRARRPQLYAKLTDPTKDAEQVTLPGWKRAFEK